MNILTDFKAILTQMSFETLHMNKIRVKLNITYLKYRLRSQLILEKLRMFFFWLEYQLNDK